MVLLLCLSPACAAAYDVEALRADLGFFSDGSCSLLKKDVTQQDLAGFRSGLLKTVAAGLLDATYDKTLSLIHI